MAAASIAMLNHHQESRRRMESARNVYSTTLKLPAEAEWIKSGTLEKRAFSSTEVWNQRRVVLTKEMLAVTRVDSDDIIDQVFLVEVEGTDHKLPAHTADAALATSTDTRRRSSQAGIKHLSPSSPQSLLPISDWQAARDAATFGVRTSLDGHNAGRTYEFRAESKESCIQWLQQIEEASRLAKWNAGTSVPFLEKARNTTKKCYDSFPIQIIIAILILFNFALACIRVEIMPEEGTSTSKLFDDIDIFFTAIFTFEVLINLFGNWFYPFWKVGWNVFDFVIVSASLISIPLSNVPGFSPLRLLRVFRVVRLFRRLKSLRKIISALSAALLPVANAFLVLSLVTVVYAVIAVHLFSDNPLFQTLSASVFSMFQICTGDSWATTIVRPMFGPTNTEIPHFPIAFFFFSYILFVGTFLLNVVIAVLLDEFISAVQRHKQKKLQEEEVLMAEARRQAGGALDPLFHKLANMSSKAELSESIRTIYRVLDRNDSGGLEYGELRDGLRMLQFDPPLHLSEEDFDHLTDGHRLCTENGELSVEAFEEVLEKELDNFTRRHMAWKVFEIEQSDPSLAGMLILLNHMSRKIDSQNTAAKGEKYAGNERPREEHPDARAGAEGRVAGGAEAVLATFGLESGRRAEEDARLARLEAEVRDLHRKIAAHSSALEKCSAKMDRMLRLLEGSGVFGAGSRHSNIGTA